MFSSASTHRSSSSCQGRRRLPRRCRSSESGHAFAAVATIADAIASAESNKSVRPWAGRDTARRLGLLLEGQSDALDGELQEYERVDDGLQRLRGELQEVRATFSKDFEDVRNRIQELAADFHRRLEVKAPQPRSEEELVADVQRRLEEKWPYSGSEDRLEQFRCKTDHVQNAFHQDLLRCRYEIDALKVSVKDLCNGADHVAELRGFLQCHTSECLGQIGALWSALGKNSMSAPASTDLAWSAETMPQDHSLQQKKTSTPRQQTSRSTLGLTTPVVTRSASSPERTGTPLSREGGSSRTASCLPPRPVDSPRIVPAQSVHLRGRCSDVDACAL